MVISSMTFNSHARVRLAIIYLVFTTLVLGKSLRNFWIDFRICDGKHYHHHLATIGGPQSMRYKPIFFKTAVCPWSN